MTDNIQIQIWTIYQDDKKIAVFFDENLATQCVANLKEIYVAGLEIKSNSPTKESVEQDQDELLKEVNDICVKAFGKWQRNIGGDFHATALPELKSKFTIQRKL